MSNIQINEYREFIILAEILALLHDLGKVNDPSFEKKQYSHQYHIDVLQIEMGFASQSDTEVPLKMISNSSNLFKQFAQIKWTDLKNIKIPNKLVEKETEIGITSIRHHFTKEEQFPITLLQNIIAQADNMDSAEDRTNYIVAFSKNKEKKYQFYNNKKQSKNVCNPFGMIVSNTEDNKAKREQFYRKWDELFKNSCEDPDFVHEVISKREELISLAKEYWHHAPAMSIYPDNDTSVWDHCFATASIAKAILASAILRKESIDEFEYLVNGVKHLFLKNECYYLIAFKSKKTIDEILSLFSEQPFMYSNENQAEYISLDGSAEEKYVSQYRGKNYDYYAIVKIVYCKNIDAKSIQDSFYKNFHKKIVTEKQDISVVRLKGKSDKYLHLFRKGSSNRKNPINLIDSLVGLPNVLAVQYPGRDFRTRAFRTTDFLGRNIALEQVLKDVKNMIENTYALGNMVYEDVNGIYFIVPFLEGLTVESQDAEDYIASKITELFNLRLDGDILPKVSFMPCHVTKTTINFGKTIVALKKEYETNLKKKLPAYNLANLSVSLPWINQWEEKLNYEICHICGRRPVERSTHYQYEKACDWCVDLRNRALGKKSTSLVLNNSEQATFIDQIRDQHNKVALLVGEFSLFDLWLSGDYVMTNMNVSKMEENKKVKLKLPSPSRLRAVVNSTSSFYQQIIEKLRSKTELSSYKISVNLKFEDNSLILEEGFYKVAMTKEMLKDAIKNVDTITDNKLKDQHNYFVDQVLATSNSFGLYIHDKERYTSTVTVKIPYKFNKIAYESEWIKKVLKQALQNSKEMISDQTGEKIDLKNLFVSIEVDDEKYIEIREIYSFADEFMWLVPANQVVEILEVFKEQFQKHFTKAQGRLSLSVGSVFFDHKYPLYLVFDAGQNMQKKLEFKIEDEIIEAMGYRAVVESNQLSENGNQATLTLKFNEMFNTIKKYNYDLKAEKYDDKWFTKIITVSTEDEKCTGNVTDIRKLMKDDQILFIPSIFDFQKVSSAEERLQISLADSDNGEYQRRSNPTCAIFRTRPMLFEDLFEQFKVKSSMLNNKDISSSALHKLQEQVIQFAKTIDVKEDYDLLKEYCKMLLGNIGNLEQLLDEEFLQIILDGSYFDLLELKMKHYVFDEIEKGGAASE